jgi:hypothetical protein
VGLSPKRKLRVRKTRKNKEREERRVECFIRSLDPKLMYRENIRKVLVSGVSAEPRAVAYSVFSIICGTFNDAFRS